MNTQKSVRWLIFGILMFSLSAAAVAQIGVGISVRIGPPALPVYEQPPCPGAGYFFTPGYWGWSDDDGYYWVPGTWVVAPVGLLWTPGYWGWNDGAYLWNDGYWGPTIGFYGGINYGFGYTGEGFYGGEWRGRSFYYNNAVWNVRNTHITNVYERTVVVNNNHVAYNGGEGGVEARPSAEQERYAHEHHTAALAAQRQHARAASHNRALFARENHGRPPIAATERAGEFKGRGVVEAKEAGAPYHEPTMSPREARAKAGENRNAEKPNAARQSAKERNAEQKNKNAERQQANERKTEEKNAEHKNAERQQANERKAEQKNAQSKQANERKSEEKNAEQKNAERQQANERKSEQKNTERKQADEQKAQQKSAERQQANERKS
ncbi:MAG: hypothetical protein WBV36_16285, partial [Terriglobales bacterium]